MAEEPKVAVAGAGRRRTGAGVARAPARPGPRPVALRIYGLLLVAIAVMRVVARSQEYADFT